MKRRRSISLIVAIALVLGGTMTLDSCTKSTKTAKKQSYEYTTVGKGSIESIVSSTGTLSVVNSVSVLAQMSGRIEKMNVDYNDHVTKGQVLATINTDLLKLQAKIAQASVDKAQANYDLQLLAVQNAKALFDKGLLSDYDLKTSQSTLSVDKAELSSAKASYEEIETEITQYAFITSPIDGIVLERDVAAGESVVGGSSSSSTSLFTLAGDLVKMQIKAEVDELDISSIKVGQDVRFTVEANPGETFTGSVKEIRLVPETSSNVVYYYVIILADNKSGKLLPGMTAGISFIKQKKEDIVVVPNAALRFTPTSLTDAEKQKALFLAGLGDLTAAEKETEGAKYDEMQKALASAAKSGKAPTQKPSGLASLMGGQSGGGPGGAGGMGGGMGGPPGMGGNGARKTTSTKSTSQTASAASGEAVSGETASTTAESVVVKKPLWYLDDSGKLSATMVEVGVSDGTKTEVIGADSLEGKKIILKVKAE